ncbi:hypothetical protein B9Z55_018691 [Caenorhabditis nigoni]|uniref:DDE Tnp4 domain-containing protein n=1 Tax=Caenorhabditis nigoni TaxID=1611254 RepID=A0A2G5TFB4_9PELO|nr:hypothetical protein B9Z55_018691 [Caenorhabditis nigoni]
MDSSGDESDEDKELFVPLEVVQKVEQAVDSETNAGNMKLSSFEQCVIFLQYSTTGESVGCISRRVGVAKSTVSSVIKRVSQAIVKHLNNIEIPSTPHEWRVVEEGFVQKGLMRCAGSLDGKHIRIKAPPNSGSVYYNYKHFFSFSMLGLVDANRKVLFLDIGTPGSLSDSSIFNRSELKRILEEKSTLPPPIHYTENLVFPSFILADGIFALTTYLMKPFGRSNLTREQLHFNRKLSNTRVRVEHCFGIIASRFRIMHSCIELMYADAVELVTALVILHNYLMPSYDGPLTPVVESAAEQFRNGKEQREALMNFLCN